MKSKIQVFLEQQTSPTLLFDKETSGLHYNSACHELLMSDIGQQRLTFESGSSKQFKDRPSVSVYSVRQVEFSKAHSRALSERIVEAQEGERRRLSREVHDGILQCIVGSRMLLARALVGLPRSSDLFESLISVEESLAQANLEGRKLLKDLRPALSEQLGLREAVSFFLERAKQEFQLRIECVFDDQDVKFPTVVRNNLFRIVQECVRNAAKHSGTKRVKVSIGKIDEEAWVSVQDWGRGFCPDEVKSSGFHIGLASMHERAKCMGGRCKIESEPGKGAKIEVRVPLIFKQRNAFANLRSRAQAVLYKRPADPGEEALVSGLSSHEVAALFHEFEVNRMELEIQNNELRRVQSKLEISQRGFRNLYEYAPIGYVEIDANERITSANLTLSSMLGCPGHELIGRTIDSFLEPSFRGHSLSDQTCEVKIQGRKPPGWFWARLENRFVSNGYRQLTVTNITAAREAEAEIANLRTQVELTRARESLALRREDSLLETEALLREVLEKARELTESLRPESLEQEAAKSIKAISRVALSKMKESRGLPRSVSAERTCIDSFLSKSLNALHPSPIETEIQFFPEAAEAEFLGDPLLLGIILENLLQLAEHSIASNNGRITLRTGFVELDGLKMCFLDVANTSEDTVEQAAELAQQMASSLRETRAIAEALGGRLSSLTQTGRGTTFRVLLPLIRSLPLGQV